MRFQLTITVLYYFPTNGKASVLTVWESGASESTFAAVLDGHLAGFRDGVATPPPDLTAHGVYLALLLAYALYLTRRLPRARAYAARAARAMSRTRATIARKPLERWLDK